LGRKYTREEFEDLCFAFGVELDDEISEKEKVRREQGEAAAAGLSDEVLYKIEVPANRYDLLCMEGLSRALQVFLGLQPVPTYSLAKISTPIQLKVTSSTSAIRPFCVAAVLRGVTFNQDSYDSFIALQEKLHQNICRERTLVAIGTHDLDTIKAPFSYEALKPTDISFVPLKESRVFNAQELFKYYEDEKAQSPLKKYLPIIKDSPVYPVIYDANRVVLSLPPIINGEHSKIKLSTKNVFIECTATDLTKANIVLNMVVTMFSQYCSVPFQVEPVEVIYEATQEKQLLPDLSNREFDVSLGYLNKGIGIEVTLDKARELLNKMQLWSKTVDLEKGLLKVIVPPVRTDIIHPCDIMEDLAIAFGYNNIQKTFPKSMTIAKQQPLNKLSGLLRELCAQAGFTEALTWSLISKKDNFLNMRLDPTEIAAAVELGPARKSLEFEIVRTSLIPGLLKTLSHNRGKMSLPLQIFEVSDVTLLDEARDVGARNERRLGAVFCGKVSGLEVVHGLLDRIMAQNNFVFSGKDSSIDEKGVERETYRLEESTHPSFFPDLGANILSGRSGLIGCMGVLHPEVLENFGIDAPCSVLELNVEIFL
jgi:phenylalanyl-tRNA synthetase beta chain